MHKRHYVPVGDFPNLNPDIDLRDLPSPRLDIENEGQLTFFKTIAVSVSIIPHIEYYLSY